MNEVWKPVLGYEGIYEVSNIGRVRSIDRVRVLSDGRTRFFPGVTLVGKVGTHGYRAVTLSDKVARTVVVHRIVAEAFLPREIGKNWINHRDGDKLNNAADNLEWCTPKENTAHMIEAGLADFPSGERMGMAKLTESDVVVIRSLARRGIMLKDIAKSFGVSPPVISNICARKAWRHVA